MLTHAKGGLWRAIKNQRQKKTPTKKSGTTPIDSCSYPPPAPPTHPLATLPSIPPPRPAVSLTELSSLSFSVSTVSPKLTSSIPAFWLVGTARHASRSTPGKTCFSSRNKARGQVCSETCREGKGTRR